MVKKGEPKFLPRATPAGGFLAWVWLEGKKRNGRCEGMGNVRDGKVLRDTDSWGKKKTTNARGRAKRDPPYP